MPKTDTPARESAGARTPLDDIRYELLCGLMAAPALAAYDEAILRRLLFSGAADIRTVAVRRSLASLAEAVGARTEAHNRQVRLAHRRLRTRLLDCWRDGDGPGHPYHHRLAATFPARREPRCRLAYWAVKRLSLAVSTIGPALERTLLRVWWTLDAGGARVLTLDEWARALCCSRPTALRHLRLLAAADIGVALQELSPEPRAAGERGCKPRRYLVSAVLPPHGKLPDGAERHRQRRQHEDALIAELDEPTPAPAPVVAYTDGPDGRLVAYDGAIGWDDEDEGELPPTFWEDVKRANDLLLADIPISTGTELPHAPAPQPVDTAPAVLATQDSIAQAELVGVSACAPTVDEGEDEDDDPFNIA